MDKKQKTDGLLCCRHCQHMDWHSGIMPVPCKVHNEPIDDPTHTICPAIKPLPYYEYLMGRSSLPEQQQNLLDTDDYHPLDEYLDT